jgi:hypothetical protein
MDGYKTTIPHVNEIGCNTANNSTCRKSPKFRKGKYVSYEVSNWRPPARG